MLYIHNTTILTPHERIERGAVLIKGERIAAVGTVDDLPCPSDAESYDAAGLILAPGLIDGQLNGAFGHDFTADPSTIWKVAAALPRYGVTAFLPTIITAPPETIRAAQAVLAAGPPADFVGAMPLGLHLEGPFLHIDRKGAHNPAYLRHPTLEYIADWMLPNVRLVTLAPELEGATALIEALAKRGVVVSAGHSTATYVQAQAAWDAGARYSTHLFNAMTPLHHREPGLAGAALDDQRVTTGLIADGVHVHPALVRLIWRMLGPQRLNLVTDAMAALGMPDGRYLLGDHAVTVAAGVARLDNGTLAGSVLSLDVALRNLMAWTDCSLVDALRTVSSTPARLLNVTDQIGSVASGRYADLILLTPQGDVQTTICRGTLWQCT